MGRKLGDWLTAYMKFVARTEPHRRLHRWTAISTIAAALRRKCWNEFAGRIYPNFYIVVVAPSGCRKGTAIGIGLDMLQAIQIPVAAESVTREKLIRNLATVRSSYIDSLTGMPVIFSALTVYSMELAVFLADQNPRFFADLCDWFDCRNLWRYETKNCGEDAIEGLWLNLIGATTPEILKRTIPMDAIGGGLTSRMILVFADRKHQQVANPKRTKEELDQYDALVKDLEYISLMQGEFMLTDEAATMYENWYLAQDANPPFDDFNFAGYMERRPLHLRKLMMVISASRGEDMLISSGDFKRSLAILEETESEMPKAMRGYGRVDVSELFPRVMAYIAKRGEISRSALMRVFYKDISMEELNQMLVTLQTINFAQLLQKGNEVWIVCQKSDQPEAARPLSVEDL